MSSDEEKAIIGGLVIEHGEVKRRIAALELKMGEMSRALGVVGRTLEQPALMVQRAAEFKQNLSILPERQDVLDLIEEYGVARRRRDEIQKSMKEIGLDVQ